MTILKENQVANPQRTWIDASEKTERLRAAEISLRENPKDPERWMELGLALAKMRLMRESVEAFSRGLILDPFHGLLYRHRGHRHLSCWQYEEAASDFTLASRLIPDNWDVWYHLGLSFYLLRDYVRAEAAYKNCYALSEKDDRRIPISDWYWRTLMRLGKKQEAEDVLSRITPEMDRGKDGLGYHRNLLMYKGLIQPDDLMQCNLEEGSLDKITMAYARANFYYVLGDVKTSDRLLEEVIAEGDSFWWSAFGYLEAKADKAGRGV